MVEEKYKLIILNPKTAAAIVANVLPSFEQTIIIKTVATMPNIIPKPCEMAFEISSPFENLTELAFDKLKFKILHKDKLIFKILHKDKLIFKIDVCKQSYIYHSKKYSNSAVFSSAFAFSQECSSYWVNADRITVHELFYRVLQKNIKYSFKTWRQLSIK